MLALQCAMPDFHHLGLGLQRPQRDPRQYSHAVKFVIPENGMKQLLQMYEFYTERGLRSRELVPCRRHSDYMKAFSFLFPDESMAREFHSRFGGEYIELN